MHAGVVDLCDFSACKSVTWMCNVIKERYHDLSKYTLAVINKAIISWVLCNDNIWICGEAARTFYTLKPMASSKNLGKSKTYTRRLVISSSKNLSKIEV